MNKIVELCFDKTERGGYTYKTTRGTGLLVYKTQNGLWDWRVLEKNPVPWSAPEKYVEPHRNGWGSAEAALDNLAFTFSELYSNNYQWKINKEAS